MSGGSFAADPRNWLSHAGIKRDWVRTGVTTDSAADMARRYHADPAWGEPLAAFVWEKETWRNEWDCGSETKVFACIFPNNRVVAVRFNKNGQRISHYAVQGGAA